MQTITQQLRQMPDSAAIGEFLRSCQFCQASRPSVPEKHRLGTAEVEGSRYTQTQRISSDSALQNRGMTDYARMLVNLDGSKLESSLSQSKPPQQPHQNASQRGLSGEHPQTWNHRHHEQEPNSEGLLHRRLTSEIASSPEENRPDSQDSQVGRLRLLQEQHQDVLWHRRNEVERAKQHKLDYPPVLPCSLQKPTLSTNSIAHDPPGQKKSRAVLGSFDAEPATASIEDFQAVELKGLDGKASSKLRQNPKERGVTIGRKQQHKVSTAAGPNTVNHPREYYKQASQHLPSFLQQLQPQPQDEEQSRQQVSRPKLHEERPSQAASDVAFPVGQRPEFRPALASHTDLPESKEKASRQRRLHLELEEEHEVRSVYESKGFAFDESSSDPSTNSHNFHEPSNSYAGTQVAGAATFAAASSSVKELSATAGAHVTTLVPAESPASATKQANVPSAGLQAEPPILAPPSAPAAAAAVAQPLLLENGHLLPANSPRRQAVTSGAIPGIVTEHADAFYFAAAGIGCTALLCVAGSILLLAIFRSYRLRHQKHETAKQLIRKIYCSGELPTRELVVQYSRELRSQKQQHKDNRHQTPAQSSWKPSSSNYCIGRTPTAPTVVLQTGQQHGEDTCYGMTSIKAAVRTGKPAQTGGEKGSDQISQNERLKEGHCSSGAPAAEDRNGHGSPIIETKSEVVKSRQTTVTPIAEGAAVYLRKSVDLPLKEQPLRGKAEVHAASKLESAQIEDSSSGRLRGKDTSSSTILKQVIMAAVERRNSAPAGVKWRRQDSSLSPTDASLVALGGPRGTSPSGLSKGTPLVHTHPYKHEVRLLQSQKRGHGGLEQGWQQSQPGKEEQQQCSTYRRHCVQKQKVSCKVEALGCVPSEQCSCAAPGGSISIFLPAFSLPRALFMSKKKQQQVRASGCKQDSPLSCHPANTGQKALPYNDKTCLSSCSVPARVISSARRNVDDKNRLPGVSVSACRLAELLHPSSRTSSSSAKGGRSQMTTGSGSSTTDSTTHFDARKRSSFFRCGRVLTRRASDCQYGDNFGKKFAVDSSQKGHVPSCLGGNQPALTPADPEEKVTWVSEVSDEISCSLGTKSCLYNERSYADEEFSAADNSERGGLYLSSHATPPEWEECSNTDIPVHMMTTAVNKDDEESSEALTSSNGEVIENGDDAIVEFDIANVSVEIEDSAHCRQTASTH